MAEAVDFARFEVLLDDYRVQRIAEDLRRAYPGKLDEVAFLSFIQPPGYVPAQTPAGLTVRQKVAAKAVFAVLAPDPRPWRSKGDGLMTASHMPLADWRTLERERAHFVSGEKDLAYIPFLRATLDVMNKVQSASEQIN